MRKKHLLAAVWSVVALVWITIAASYATGVGLTARIVLVTTSALALEAAFWISAAILGITVLESRRRIIAFVRGRLGRADER